MDLGQDPARAARRFMPEELGEAARPERQR
jgi:hypothetical protein